MPLASSSAFPAAARRPIASRPPAAALAGSFVCAVAAWVSLGILTVTGDASSPRAGILPDPWIPLLLLLGLAVAAAIVQRPSRAWWPTFIPGVLLLPWLPLNVPAVFLLWTGPVAAWVWIGAATASAVALWPAPVEGRGRMAGWLREPRVGGAVALVAALIVYASAAWTSSAVHPGGDEPSYLVITQSLLLDGDLRIENNHKRRDYAAYYSGALRPDFLRRGRDGQIYSIHAPGLPALVAPAFAVGGYQAVVAFLVLVSALGSWLVWRLSFALTSDAGAAWFGWAATCFSAPFLCHASAVFPDGVGAVLVLVGVAALVRLEQGERPSGGSRAKRLPIWMLYGAALAMLPWLHTRFAAAAGVLGVCVVLRLASRRRLADLAAFIAIPLASAAGWFGYFHAIYGSYNPASPYGSYSQSSLSNLWPGLPALLLDQQYGVLPNAPIYAVAFAGLPLMLRSRRRLAIELGVLLVVYLAAVASYNMWWGGWSAPARFAVPVLLALGPAAAVFWARGGAVARAAGLLALVLSLLIGGTLTLVAGGRLMFNSRDGVARWLEWLCPLVDLPRALPSFFHGTAWSAVLHAAVWLIVVLGGWLALNWIGTAHPAASNRASLAPVHASVSRARLATFAVLLFVAGATTASAIVWTLDGVSASAVTPTTAQLRLLSAFDAVRFPVGVRYQPLSFTTSSDVPTRLRVATSERRPPVPDQPLLLLREVPAGTYRLRRAHLPALPRELQVRVTGARMPSLPLQRCVLDPSQPYEECLVRLPINARELNVVSESAAGLPARAVQLQPVEMLPASARPATDRAGAAARYGDFTVFTFDNLVFLEREGLWVTGGAEARLVTASDASRPAMSLLVRNGPAPNRVHLRLGGRSFEFALAPREERLVRVPLDSRSRAALIEVFAEGGFRPRDMDPNTSDDRYLGVWLEIPQGQ